MTDRRDSFVMHYRALRKSPAWRALSGEGHKVLHRIEEEHMDHGGKDNGALIVTYDDFQENYIGHRRTIARGIREAEAVGLLRRIRGRAGNGEFKTPSLYRLTYLSTYEDGKKLAPTEEWREVKSMEDARARLDAVKEPPKSSAWARNRTAKVMAFSMP
jgi:hypothetical protein